MPPPGSANDDARQHEPRAPRARAPGHAGRRVQPSARLRRGRRRAAVHRLGGGLPCHRRRRPRICGPRLVVGRAHRWARPSRCDRGDRDTGAARHVVRRAESTRSRARGEDHRLCGERGDGPFRIERHRGGHERASARARRDRPRHHSQIRGLLSRARRRAPLEGGIWPRDARTPGLRGRTRCGRSRHDHRRLRRP